MRAAWIHILVLVATPGCGVAFTAETAPPGATTTAGGQGGAGGESGGGGAYDGPSLSGFTTTPGVTLQVGGNGGTGFEDECLADEAIVGWTGFSQDGGGPIGLLRASCAALTPDGAMLSWSEVTSETPDHGSTADESLGTIVCPANEVMVGFDGRADTLVRGFQMICAPVGVAKDGASMVHGPSTTLPLFGNENESSGELRCPQGSVARMHRGKSGTLIDQFGVRCDVLVPEL